MLMRVEFYIELQKIFTLCEFIPEYTLGDIKADAYFEIWQNGFAIPYFLEVQISPRFNQDKYEKMYDSGAWLDKWEEFPAVVVVSDNRISYRPSSVKFVQIGGDMNGIRRICSTFRAVV
jgi:hypothetical protein